MDEGKAGRLDCKMIINAAGAAISAVVLLILFITKFALVWPIVIFMPIVIWAFMR